jgi:GNAT superfamily N-acetyltransferase
MSAMLDLTLPAGQGLTLRIIERPDLALGPRALAQVLADLRSVAERVLPRGDLRYGVLSGDREALETTIITLVHEARTGRPVAFNVLVLMDADLAGRAIEILHLGLVMVDPAFRGRGLSERLYGSTCLALFLRRLGRPLRLSSVTQVPAVVGMVAEIFDDVFPTPQWPTDPSFAHRFLARQIMARHRKAFGVGDDAWFDEDRSIIRNAYTGGSDDLKKTFEAAPKHRDRAFNAFCADSLDYGRGDDFLQIGEINARTAGRWLDRITRPASVPWLAGHLALFALRRAVLPPIRWLDEIRHWQHWGALHPWKQVRP